MRHVVALLVVPLLFVGACADDEVSGQPSFGPAPVYAAGDVVLRVGQVDGYPDVFGVARLPAITVYGDGRVITDEAGREYPPNALPNVLVRAVSADAVRALAQLAIDAGVGWRPDYTPPMDGGLTLTGFTVLTDQGPRGSTLYEHFEQDLLNQQRELADLRDTLADLSTALDAFDVGEQQPYAPAALAAVNRPWGDQSPAGGGTSEPERAWPGPALPGDPLDGGLSCLTVTGDDLAAVVGEAAGARRTVPWMWDGQEYEVRFRPLLPDETSCADLVG